MAYVIQPRPLAKMTSLVVATHEDSKNPYAISNGETTPLLQDGGEPLIRAYWWRWIVLAVFVLNLAVNNVIWITFGPIADVIGCYYNISDFWVNSLSMIYMMVYIVLVLPNSWMLSRMGLRTAVVLSSFTTALGACLRLTGCGPEHFWLLLSGQTVAALCNSLMWGATSLLSEMWFPPSERATSSAFGGGISAQLGVMMGYALSPTIVDRSDTNQICGNDTHTPPRDTLHYWEWNEAIFNRLFYYLLGQTVFSLATFLLTLVAFPEAPPTPPSISRKLEGGSSIPFWSSLLKVVKNGYFLLFMLTFGINIAVQGSYFTVANEVVHPNFQNSDKEIAYMGLIAEAVSIVAMLVVARLLDWTKAFYALSVVLYVTAAVSVAGFAASVLYQKNFIVVCATFTFTSATTTSFMAVAYEYAVEMTYPLPEGTSAGLMNATSQILSIVLIVVVGNFATKNVSIGVWFITGVTAFGALLTLFIRPELRRVKLDNPKLLGIQGESPS